jgi:hypothetical protein
MMVRGLRKEISWFDGHREFSLVCYWECWPANPDEDFPVSRWLDKD